MSKLRSPWIGPIIGHTTATSARVWIRAISPDDNGVIPSSNNRTVGVVTILNEQGNADPTDLRRTYYFRLRREFDRTGTITLGQDVSFGISQPTQELIALGHGFEPFPLQPDTVYRIRVGVLIADDGYDDNEAISSDNLLKSLPPPGVWVDALMDLPESESAAQFRTFSAEDQTQLRFLVGSCRYPGILFKNKKADAIFDPMRKKIEQSASNDPIRFVLMIGDQIYADFLNRAIPVGRADTYEEFQERYIEAFGSPNLRKLFQSIPHYMILDDHEIEDNWTQDRIKKSETRSLFQLAIGAYMSYQWSHGPRTYDRHLYYSFECGGFPFFVLDTRTQRYRDDVENELADNHLLGQPSPDPDQYPTQLDLLCNWLIKQQQAIGNKPKFIVSASVFVPNDITTTKSDKQKNASDSWEAFPSTRRQLLDTIVEHRIQNVVFLSGDIHCSCVAELTFKGSETAEQLKAFSITSSAFYWPFPFADGDPTGFVHDSEKQKDTFMLSNKKLAFSKLRMDYKAYNFCQDDNFCQVDLDWNARELRVQVFGKDGEPLKLDNAMTGASSDLKSTLKLAE